MKKSPIPRFLVYLLGAWAVVMLVRAQYPNTSPAELIPAAKRETARGMDFTLLDGGKWSLKDHAGRVTIVNFWATWCPPCQAETPDLVRLGNARKDVDFLGVSVDEGNLGAVQRFVKDYKIPYPVANSASVPYLGESFPIPVTLVFDKKGRVAVRTIGAISHDGLDRALTQLQSEVD